MCVVYYWIFLPYWIFLRLFELKGKPSFHLILSTHFPASSQHRSSSNLNKTIFCTPSRKIFVVDYVFKAGESYENTLSACAGELCTHLSARIMRCLLTKFTACIGKIIKYMSIFLDYLKLKKEANQVYKEPVRKSLPSFEIQAPQSEDKKVDAVEEKQKRESRQKERTPRKEKSKRDQSISPYGPRLRRRYNYTEI